MAGSFSNFTENELLDHLFGGNTAGNVYTPPTNLYVGLGTATAGTDQDASFSNEVSGNAYARVTVANTTTNWSAASGGSKTNATAITFPQATGTWGTVTQFGIWDASSAGNLIAWGDLTVAKAVSTNDTLSFAASALTITLA